MMTETDSSTHWAPHFVGIGAEKAATTWVWNKLDQHSAIEMSQPKELNYFSEQFARGPAWYRRHFANSADCLQGEISPLYMDHPDAAARMADACPDAKLLVMLRNPFDRAISHLMHDAQNTYGGIAELTASQFQVLVESDDRYVRRSCYAAGLRPFLTRFRRDRIGIFFYDDVHRQPLSLIQNIYDFLGVDRHFVPDDLETAVNKSQNYRSALLHRAASRVSQTAKAFPVSRHLLEWVYRTTTLRERAIELLMVDNGRPDVTAADVLSDGQLNVIADDLEQLSTVLEIDVPATWWESEIVGGEQRRGGIKSVSSEKPSA